MIDVGLLFCFFSVYWNMFDVHKNMVDFSMTPTIFGIWTISKYLYFLYPYQIPFWPKNTSWYVIHSLDSTNTCSRSTKITYDLHIAAPPMLMTNRLNSIKMIYHKIAPIVWICLATCSLYDWICLHNESIFNLPLEP